MSESVVKQSRQGGVRYGLVLGGVALLALFGAIGKRFAEVKVEQAAVMASNTEQAAAHAAPREVKVIRPAPTTWRAVVHVTGSVAPIRETMLGFKQPGRLASVNVALGDKVTAGQLLGSLDPVDVAAQSATTVAMVRAAELDVAIQQENEQRSKKLFDSHAISETEYRGALHMVEGAVARLDTAKAQAAAAGVAVANTRLVAPFAGTIVQAPTAAGAVVMPGSPLFRIEDTSALRLTSSVSPADVANVPLGAVVEIDGTQALRGKVTVIFPSVDAQTRRVPVYAELPNDPASPLLAGLFVRAHVTAPGEADALKLPAAALKAGSQDEVWVIRNGKAATATIVFSTGEDGTLYVRDGVSAKDDVILAAGQAMQDGDAVRGTSISDGRTP